MFILHPDVTARTYSSKHNFFAIQRHQIIYHGILCFESLVRRYKLPLNVSALSAIATDI